ncbi:MAG: hypothetical protein H7249_05100 [Chitinophagaceae bacterium]|nr:hypothetical protein [Oligoflexus sp.]
MTDIGQIDHHHIVKACDEAFHQTLGKHFSNGLLTPDVSLDSVSESLEVELQFQGLFSGSIIFDMPLEGALNFVTTLPIVSFELSDQLVRDIFTKFGTDFGQRFVVSLLGNHTGVDLHSVKITLGTQGPTRNRQYTRQYETGCGGVNITVASRLQSLPSLAKGA